MVIYKLFRTEKVQKEMFGPICVWKSVNLLLIEVGRFKLPAVITFFVLVPDFNSIIHNTYLNVTRCLQNF